MDYFIHFRIKGTCDTKCGFQHEMVVVQTIEAINTPHSRKGENPRLGIKNSLL